ncbi:DUF3089 domain-containing protein [Novosphingobium sp. 9]|uniref:DUF3089 domain-containing protein n=1 Tax=Novosphingobium sp. 9 TaxID=2025349 RepID=UPI0021B54CF9|nr:DUF3089 domain-containing protein [Novosphingobium sp. 9]
MARKFLYAVAGLVVLALAAVILLRIYADELTEMAFVPTAKFVQQPPVSPGAYNDPRLWISRPASAGGNPQDDPARWLPPGVQSPEKPLHVAVFFVHPTSFVARSAWNASLSDPEANGRARLFVKANATPFNATPDLWAPRYRQAAVGAFLTDDPQASQALQLAYGDVLAAFDVFLKNAPKDEPIVLAGHSQGAFMLRRLMRDRVAGQPLARRIVAVYAVGWPVSLEHDLPRMGLPACHDADSTGCVASWISFADPDETQMLRRAYGRRMGLDFQRVGDSPFLCTNPLTGASMEPSPDPSASGTPASQHSTASVEPEDDATDAPPSVEADAKMNLGTLVPDFKTWTGTLAPGMVPARCGPDDILHIGSPPELDLGPYVLPGNNYHLYDVMLFWANLRADFEHRVEIWTTHQAQLQKAAQHRRHR